MKLKADRESEGRILHALKRHSAFDILSEECGAIAGVGGDGPRWIVDPLDGSFNYLCGIPLCCVSVGLWVGMEPLLGVVYDFNRRELFTGIVNVGAWLNEAPIHVSSMAETSRAVLCTGFPVGTDFSPDALSQFIEQVRQYKKIRLLGSAALMLAYVAAGRAEAYYERDIKIWDVAAGLAIVRGAGGQIVRALSNRPQAWTVYAGNSLIPVPSF